MFLITNTGSSEWLGYINENKSGDMDFGPKIPWHKLQQAAFLTPKVASSLPSLCPGPFCRNQFEGYTLILCSQFLGCRGKGRNRQLSHLSRNALCFLTTLLGSKVSVFSAYTSSSSSCLHLCVSLLQCPNSVILLCCTTHFVSLAHFNTCTWSSYLSR